MNKLVNIYPSMPITSLRIPLRTRVTNITMDCESIRKCIIANAIVEEVLEDNSVIRLNLSNYNKNNNPTNVSRKSEKHIHKSTEKNIETIKIIDTEKSKNKIEEKHDNTKKEDIKLSTHEVKVDEATIISAEEPKTDLSDNEAVKGSESKAQPDKNQNVSNKQQNAKKEEVKKVRPNNNK